MYNICDMYNRRTPEQYHNTEHRKQYFPATEAETEAAAVAAAEIDPTVLHI